MTVALFAFEHIVSLHRRTSLPAPTNINLMIVCERIDTIGFDDKIYFQFY